MKIETLTKPKTSSHQDITTEDVDRIVNSRIQALQQPPAVQSPASSSGQENVTKADLQAMFKSFQETIFWGNKTLNNSKKSVGKKAEDLAIRRFLSDLLRERGNEAPGIDHDPVDDITDKPDSDSSSDNTSFSDSSDSDTSSSDSSDSDGDLNVHIAKSKKSEAEV
ncbi:hypothetical protein GLOIN_2v1886689 [Rhizophagus clarus]|uniref:Uncharacterized protein n=1 Tax=Rhizophagus clarus TaxID=94130 RepID=A0A8H3QQG8_9GLOM|nr:hypothetical protein GLOIN_2v1886689 [Rhizophagus clarus]